MVKGAGVVARESMHWGDFAVVTTASPWAVARPMLQATPRVVLVVESLERSHLEALARTAGPVERVVGLGSGLAMDGAKYVAWRWGAALVQVPSTTSNNACFTRTAGCLEQGRRAPLRDAPIPEQVLVDRWLIARAPARLNRAGVGDLVCSHTSLVDWQLAHAAGLDMDWDEALRDRARRALERLAAIAPAVGAHDLDALIELLEISERFAPDFLAFPKARFNACSEHLLAWCLEQRTGRRLVHGEIVSLAVLLMAHLQDNDPERAARVIHAARVGYRPEEIGTTWREVEDAMLALPEYAREVVPWYSIVNVLAEGPGGSRARLRERFHEARAFVEALAQPAGARRKTT
jgi:glycerol dehydrogenase-like iron-containing ADH family enzyme